MARSLNDCAAPAKLNLFLHVTGRRADGYHLLQSVFQLIDLHDTLHFTQRDDDLIVRSTDIAGLPAEQDLTVRAAKLLQSAAQFARKMSAEMKVLHVTSKISGVGTLTPG